MKLTIVSPDNLVSVDGVSIKPFDMTSVPEGIRALQWSGEEGHLEFYDYSPNKTIDELPDWATDLVSAWETKKVELETVVAPTDTEKLNAIKFKAQGLLNNSDFVMLSDVRLTNKADWETYRASLRTIRSNPTLTAVFPTIPDLDWAT